MTPQEIIAHALRPTANRYGLSRWQEFDRCPEAYRLKYREKLHPIARDEGRDIGTAAHIGMAAATLTWREYQRAEPGSPWYEMGDPNTEALKMAKAALDEAFFLPIELRDYAMVLLQLYATHYGTEDALHGQALGFSAWAFSSWIVAVEPQLKIETSTVPIEDRPDAIVKFNNRWHWVDHKTSARTPPLPAVVWDADATPDPNDDALRALKTNPQFLEHSAVLREKTGHLCPGIVNYFIKTTSPAFYRVLIEHTHEEIDRWLAMQKARLEHNMHSPRAESPNPETSVMHYEECVHWTGKKCWAFNYCHGTPEQRATEYTQKEEREGDE